MMVMRKGEDRSKGKLDKTFFNILDLFLPKGKDNICFSYI